MARLPDAVVGDAYTSTALWELLSDLVDVGNRMAGQAGERQAARIVADALADAGCRSVGVEEFGIPGWWRGSSAIELPAPRERRFAADHEVIALPGTPAGTVAADLVDVGHGTDGEFADADLDGAIAMARSDVPEDADRWIHRMEKYAAAAETGAVGFVFRNHVEGALPPTGEVGYQERPGPIPAVGVSKEVGARLARHAREASEDGGEENGEGKGQGKGEEKGEGEGKGQGKGEEKGEGDARLPGVTLSVECRNEPTNSRNVEAVVGPDTDREVLVTAHVDAHDLAEGANDNGTGCAVVGEVGRLLTRAEGQLDARVRLVTFGAEEIGLYGAYRWAETHDLDRVKAVINVDSAGDSRNLRVGYQGFEGLRAAIEAATDRLDAPLSTDGTVSPHGDQWAFVAEGVPAAFATTASGESGRGWGHTHADTLDKLDPRILRDVAVQVAECAIEVADDDRTFQRRSREAVHAELREGYVRELKVGGRWPFEGEPDPEPDDPEG